MILMKLLIVVSFKSDKTVYEESPVLNIQFVTRLSNEVDRYNIPTPILCKLEIRVNSIYVYT